MSALAARDDMTDDMAYEIVKTLHENIEQIVLLLPAVRAARGKPRCLYIVVRSIPVPSGRDSVLEGSRPLEVGLGKLTPGRWPGR